MKLFLPAFAFAVIFTSCTTAYRSAQTPDDVYYSPGKPVKEYTEQKDEVNEESEEDRYLRMKVRNRDRWNDLDEYYRDPYAYTYDGCYCKCNYNQRLYWSHYTPYPVRIIASRPVVVNKPRISNLHVFDNTNTADPKLPSKQKTYRDTRETYSPVTDRGSEMRTSRNSTNNTSTSTKSSSSSSSSSSGSSSSGSKNNGNAPARRF